MAWVHPLEVGAVATDLGNRDVQLCVACSRCVAVEGRFDLDGVRDRGLIADQRQVNCRVDRNRVDAADGTAEDCPGRGQSRVTCVRV